MAGSGRAMVVAAAVLAGAGAATAGPDRVQLLLGSHHFGASQDFEEFNPGLFLIWSEALWRDRLDFGIGAYRNSYGDGSLAVSAAYPILRRANWGLDLFGALAWYPGNGDRFSHAIGDIVPLAGLQARYRAVFVQAIPSGGDAADAVLSFGLSFPLP